MNIRERLIQYLDYKGISLTKAEVMLQWAKGTLTKVKGISSDKIGEFLLLFSDLSSDWLMTGSGEMLRKEIHVYPLKGTEKMVDNPIKLYDLEASANLHSLFCQKDQNILGEISIPNIPVCDGAVYVRGDSMYPLLKSGDIIAYKIVSPDIQHIFYGEMYLVSIDMDGEEYLTVKYVNHSGRGDEWIKLVSYNQYYQPKDFPLSSIRAMALVKVSIRMNTMK